MIKEDSI